MGLDAFKTEGPRKTSKTKSDDKQNQKAIHVISNVNLANVDIPDMIKEHTAEYIKDPSSDEIDEDALCICRQCDKLSTTYEAMVKADWLQYQDDEWYREFLDLALYEAPEIAGKQTNGTESKTTSDDSSSNTGGLSAFMNQT
jgi:hypothetical protein